MDLEKITKRVGSLIKLRPEYEERYLILHKYTFPGVLESIRKSNIKNYSIFLLNGILFSYFEYVGNNFESDMNSIADSTTKDWWALTDPMQEPLNFRKDGEWWASMDQVLCFDKLVKSFKEAKRIGLSAEIIPGMEKSVVELLNKYTETTEKILNQFNFQNSNIYIKEGKLYLYFEYVGNDIEKEFSEICAIPIFGNNKNDLNEMLVEKNNSRWETMKEIFHTN